MNRPYRSSSRTFRTSPVWLRSQKRPSSTTVRVGKRPILHQRTKFRKDRSNRYRDIAIFVIFEMAAAAILNFQKFEILTVDPL